MHGNIDVHVSQNNNSSESPSSNMNNNNNNNNSSANEMTSPATTPRNITQQQQQTQQLDELVKMMEKGEQQQRKSLMMVNHNENNNHSATNNTQHLIDNMNSSPSSTTSPSASSFSSPSMSRSKSSSPLHQPQQYQTTPQYNNNHHHQHSQSTPSSTVSPSTMIHNNGHHHYHHHSLHQSHIYKSSPTSPQQHPSSSSSPPPQLMTTFQSCHCLIEKLLSVLQPSPQSEEQRSFVFNAISNILSDLGLKTFLYGSVAFKTYLPDGDIDISVFETKNTSLVSTTNTTSSDNTNNNNNNSQQPWYNKVRSAFKAVQESDNPHLIIRDINFINAEVKLIKCIVNEIPIDMSSNQAGGLSTLCFLQEVDQKIGQDHLFKRSIILMKAWCYYESRILGSHHGLLSTYALTILIMYIFNVCYDEIDSPLKALSFVLQYFCQFDWDNFAISIHGPVALQSFPNIQVSDATPGAGEFFRINGRRKAVIQPFFSNEFLAECVEKYAKFDAPPPHIHRTFVPKFMNIVDPLRDYNNLGRSVSKNNHLRIRRALKKGAKSLKSILSGNVGQSERILTVFFYNTASHFDLVNIDELNRARQNSRSYCEFMMSSNTSSPRQSPSRPRSSSHTPRRQIMECMASPPSPNWIKSNKVFDSKLEDCRANLFNATTHKSSNGEMLQFDEKSTESVTQSSLRTGTIDEPDALPPKDVTTFARGKGKRRSKSNAQNKLSNNNTSSTPTPSTSSSLSSSSSAEFTPEKARKGGIPNSPGNGNLNQTGERKVGGGNGKKKTPSKPRKLRPNTLSDYINLETVSTTTKNKSRQQQKQKTSQKKKSTPSKTSKPVS